MLPSSVRSHAFQFASTTKDVNEIKHDIEELRQEALRRLDALNHKVDELSIASSAVASSTRQKDSQVANQLSIQTSSSTVTTAAKDSTNQPELILSPDHVNEEAELKNIKIEQDPKRSTLSHAAVDHSVRVSQIDDINLLDGTHWKVMLNIGREAGTWMPKTWGASGERLLLNLELEFKSNQLYEREDFLNGMAGAKELYVSEFSTAPSMSEGSRQVPVKKIGGWRVARGEGPSGTDLLRFFVEVEEEVRHSGSDVWCPSGRVYFTCGYFPLTHRDSKAPSFKDMLREELDAIVAKHEELSKEMEEDTNLISWERMKRSKELIDLRILAGKVSRQIEEAKMREPEKASLRLSRKRDVGLTQEGGLCCKVIKGLTMEYHILGKFGVACIDHRDRELHP